MSDEKEYCMILCTSPDDVHAEKLAGSLVERRLAACVQVLPIRSFYVWKGEICRDEERLILIKARVDVYSQIETFIVQNHPYEVPEIVKCQIDGGLDRYLAWIDSVTA